MKDQSYQRGVLVEERDYDTRTYTRRSALDGSLLEQRPFTPAENAAADMRLTRATEEVNENDLRSQGDSLLADLRAIVLGTSGMTQAAQTRTIARAVLVLCRLIFKKFEARD